MPFAHIAMAVEGCGWTHPDYFALMVANVVSWTLIISPTCMYLVLWLGLQGGHPPPPTHTHHHDSPDCSRVFAVHYLLFNTDCNRKRFCF